MKSIEKYAIGKLSKEIAEIEKSKRNTETPELNVYEKALIYKYSENGYQLVNENLRKSKGKKFDVFGKLLDQTLEKLPNFDGLVYRSANLTNHELRRYNDTIAKNDLLKEYSFTSTSKSRLLAMAFKGNTLFRIYSRTGKEIEKIAKFGENGIINEKEVLFSPNKNFRVLEITKEINFTLITMEEI